MILFILHRMILYLNQIVGVNALPAITARAELGPKSGRVGMVVDGIKVLMEGHRSRDSLVLVFGVLI